MGRGKPGLEWTTPWEGFRGMLGSALSPQRETGGLYPASLLGRSGNQHTHGHSLNIWRRATAAGLLAPQQTSLIWRSRDKCDGNKSTKNFTQWLGALQTIKESYWEKRLLGGDGIPAEAWMIGRSQVCGESKELKFQVGSSHGRNEDVKATRVQRG